MPFDKKVQFPKFDLETTDGADDFKVWHRKWNAYMRISGLDEEPETQQVDILTLSLSNSTLKVVENLRLTDAQRNDTEEIIKALQEHIEGKVNKYVERRKLRQRVQEHGETFEDYMVSLRQIASSCKYCDDECMETALVEQLIAGLKNQEIVKELLKTTDIQFGDATKIASAMEAAMKHMPENSSAINAFKRRAAGHTNERPTKPERKPCYKCGNHNCNDKDKCPARKAKCQNCGKDGHLTKACWGKNQQKKTTRVKNVRISGVQVQKVEKTTPAPKLKMQITGARKSIQWAVLPDSGADISAAGPGLLKALGESPRRLQASTIRTTTVSGQHMETLGMLKIKLKAGDKEIDEEIHIFKGVKGALISWSTAKRLGILHKCYPNPIPDNIVKVGKVQNQLDPESLRDMLLKEYSDVFDGQVKVMPGEKFHIHLKEDAKPFCVRTPRSVPLPYQDKLKVELDLQQKQGIIGIQTKPTDWCAAIVVTSKKDPTKIRLNVDLTKVNPYVKRERYQSLTPAEQVVDIAKSGARYFTSIDAIKGYHQIPLDEESQDITTFITPYGRFKYLRAPYGISSISEHYNRRMDEAFVGLSGYKRVVDDVLVYDESMEEHIEHVRNILQRCRDKGISLNKDKFKFGQQEVLFAGYHISKDGYRISDNVTSAIERFPKPSSRTDLRSYFGLANQLGNSTTEVAKALEPLRSLLSTKNDFLWTVDHDTTFNESRKILSKSITLSYFNMEMPTRLMTDASKLGIGFVLQQEHEKWKTTQAGSRFLSDTESRYAVIEQEMLGVVWAVKKCKYLLKGLPHFEIVTDHNPLVPILNSHRLDEIENPRLQRLRMKVAGYNFTARWQKGTKNEAADALSRSPVDKPQQKDLYGEMDQSVHEIRQLEAGEENLHLAELREHAKKDKVYQDLARVIRKGFPDKKSDLPENLKNYWCVKDKLSVDDNLIVHGCRLVIPHSLQASMLSRLHEAHQGIRRSKERALLTMYWPGMNEDIKNFVSTCKHCQDRLPRQQSEPLIQKTRPDRPFQEISMDFASYGGKEFLIIVDCKTDWPEVVHMGNNTQSFKLINVMTDFFCRTSIPDVIWSDNGTQFTSHAFQEFLKKWGIRHKTSSPHYPQSNGKAEATVKSMKKLISASWKGRSLDNNKLCKALLQYRNTPCGRDAKSPAQKLFGHPIQDNLPAHRRAFAPEWQKKAKVTESTEEAKEQNTKEHYDLHCKSMKDLDVGTRVAVWNAGSNLWDIYGTITEIGPFRRYRVKTQAGRLLVRNRKFLRRRNSMSVFPGSRNTETEAQQQASETRPKRTNRKPARLIEDPDWP